ncbi:MAG: signal peptidase II [bacterium]
MKFKNGLIYGCIALLLIVDQIIKNFFIKNLSFSRDFLFLNFSLTKNKGIAFGIPFNPLLLNILTVLFIALIAFFIFFKEKKSEIKILLFLILLAAISNFIDRICYGAVIDYISVQYFAVLNIADIMLTLGFIIIAIYLLEIPPFTKGDKGGFKIS